MPAVVSIKKSSNERLFGITPAISMAEPKPDDIKKTEELKKVLDSFNIFETKSELKRREKVLNNLEKIARKWVRDLSVERNIAPEIADKIGGKVFPFGSYLLGVHHNDADIDAVFIAPRNIDRNDFFSLFYTVLQDQPEITHCTSIEEAFVPLIKMIFDGIEIDLLFARMSLEIIPEDFSLQDDHLLENLDPRSVRSLNGRRNAAEILDLIPNVDNFQKALMTIKLWAKETGIYSNSLGYFGGISWAILVARVCQLYPNAAPSTLIEKFFVVYSKWNWPKPILLKELSDTDLGFQVWDPRKNFQHGYHLMPVITPSYPQQNSTFNVSTSTKKVIIDEIFRAASTMDAIALGKASWDRLFKGPGFFHRYRHFLVVMASSDTSDGFKSWRGFLGSKIRHFMGQLENHYQIVHPHLYPKSFKLHKLKEGCQVQSDALSARFCDMWFIGLEFVRSSNLKVNLFKDVLTFVDNVYHQASEQRILTDTTIAEVRHLKQTELKHYLDPNVLIQSLEKTNDHHDFIENISNIRKRLSTELVQQNKAKRRRVNSELNHSMDSNSSGYGSSSSPPSSLSRWPLPSLNSDIEKV